MGSSHAASETWQQARALVLEGIDDRMAVLRRLEIRKRLIEVLALASLWARGPSWQSPPSG